MNNHENLWFWFVFRFEMILSRNVQRRMLGHLCTFLTCYTYQKSIFKLWFIQIWKLWRYSRWCWSNLSQGNHTFWKLVKVRNNQNLRFSKFLRFELIFSRNVQGCIIEHLYNFCTCYTSQKAPSSFAFFNCESFEGILDDLEAIFCKEIALFGNFSKWKNMKISDFRIFSDLNWFSLGTFKGLFF